MATQPATPPVTVLAALELALDEHDDVLTVGQYNALHRAAQVLDRLPAVAASFGLALTERTAP